MYHKQTAVVLAIGLVAILMTAVSTRTFAKIDITIPDARLDTSPPHTDTVTRGQGSPIAAAEAAYEQFWAQDVSTLLQHTTAETAGHVHHP